jgi:hypothetical protein
MLAVRLVLIAARLQGAEGMPAPRSRVLSARSPPRRADGDGFSTGQIRARDQVNLAFRLDGRRSGQTVIVSSDATIEMLVVGRRGRGQLAGLFGGVSQKLVTLAPCIVIVVP